MCQSTGASLTQSPPSPAEMTPPLTLITETLDPAAAEWLGERARVEWVGHDDEASMGRWLPEADAMVVRTYTKVDPALLDRAPKLRVVGRAGVGLDNIDVAACRGRGVEVVYTPDANTQAVVEDVLGLMLDAYRPRTDLPDHADAAMFHALRKTEVGVELADLTLGIVGFGRIGKRLGRVADALGMAVHVCDLLPERELREAVAFPFAFMPNEALYASSDIVTLHVDGRASNRGMIDAAALSRFRPDALFINAARGMLVDAGAVAGWLLSNPAAGAVLDVHDPEPPPADYPLWGVANCRLLPHLASRTHTALANMSWVVRDVAAVLAGERPRHPAA